MGLTTYGGLVPMLESYPVMPDEDATTQYCIDSIVIAGSPKTVADKLIVFREEVGPFETLIISHHDWVHEAIWRRHMKLIVTEVMGARRSRLLINDRTAVRHIT